MMFRSWLGSRSSMPRILTSMSLLLLSAFLIAPASALPGPMSDADLLAKSDLVALVRMLSVTCTAISHDAFTGQDIRTTAPMSS